MTVHEKLDNLLNRIGYDTTAIYKETLLAMTSNNLNYTVPEDGNYLFILTDKVGKTDTTMWLIKHNGVLINDCISRSLKTVSDSDYTMKTAICSLSCKNGDIISSNYCSPYSVFNVFQLS